jgi:hypothetical protein
MRATTEFLPPLTAVMLILKSLIYIAKKSLESDILTAFSLKIHNTLLFFPVFVF